MRGTVNTTRNVGVGEVVNLVAVLHSVAAVEEEGNSNEQQHTGCHASSDNDSFGVRALTRLAVAAILVALITTATAAATATAGWGWRGMTIIGQGGRWLVFVASCWAVGGEDDNILRGCGMASQRIVSGFLGVVVSLVNRRSSVSIASVCVGVFCISIVGSFSIGGVISSTRIIVCGRVISSARLLAPIAAPGTGDFVTTRVE